MIAHELAHIRNRDTLTQSVAATIGGAITWIAYMLMFMGGDDDSPLGLVGAIAMMILAPIAAGLVQMAISRQREYAADATGAQIARAPNALADALERLEAGAKAMPMQVNAAAEPLYIVKPFSGRRSGRAVLHSPPDRGARQAAARDVHHLEAYGAKLSRSFGNIRGLMRRRQIRRRRCFLGP